MLLALKCDTLLILFKGDSFGRSKFKRVKLFEVVGKFTKNLDVLSSIGLDSWGSTYLNQFMVYFYKSTESS